MNGNFNRSHYSLPGIPLPGHVTGDMPDPMDLEAMNHITDTTFSHNYGINPKVSGVIGAYADTGINTDPLGMYTGRPDPETDEFGNVYMTLRDSYVIPVQDADDL
ncbi:MAG: hypothetical protein WCQ72_07600 [Eubacteriales bacterium]